jgi:DNA-binding MarR family transcriptional regulator
MLSEGNLVPSAKPRRRTPAGDALSGVVIQIFQLNGLLTAIGDALAKPAGQTTARWQVLAAVERAPMTVAQIARALHLARQSVQRVADILAAEGYVAYEDNPGHRRAKLLRLTPEGAAALAIIQSAQLTWADEVGGAVGEADLRAAGAILDRLMRTLVAKSPGGRG